MIGGSLAPASGVTVPAGAWRQADDEDLSPILATARDLFYEVGFHGTTVRDIAGRVGVTVPALYYHHANKEAILSALLDRSISSVIERCQQALSEAADDPAERFRNLIECLALYMANHRKSAAMDAEIRALSPAARKLYSIQRRRVEQMVSDTISQGVAAGEFEVTSPSDTGRALLGMIQAITLWFSPGGGRLTASELAVRYVDIAERTVGLHERRGGAAGSASAGLASRLSERLGCADRVGELGQRRASGDEPVVEGLPAGRAEDQRADDAFPHEVAEDRPARCPGRFRAAFEQDGGIGQLGAAENLDHQAELIGPGVVRLGRRGRLAGDAGGDGGRLRAGAHPVLPATVPAGHRVRPARDVPRRVHAVVAGQPPGGVADQPVWTCQRP